MKKICLKKISSLLLVFIVAAGCATHTPLHLDPENYNVIGSTLDSHLQVKYYLKATHFFRENGEILEVEEPVNFTKDLILKKTVQKLTLTLEVYNTKRHNYRLWTQSKVWDGKVSHTAYNVEYQGRISKKRFIFKLPIGQNRVSWCFEIKDRDNRPVMVSLPVNYVLERGSIPQI